MDIAGGAHALSELDFTRLIRRYRLPHPTGRRRGRIRRAAAGGSTRYATIARLVIEVDGRHHMDAAQYWADMDRDNDLTVDGYRVLRFPAFLVRYHPGYVAEEIRASLRPGVADPDPGLTWTG